MPRFHPTPPLVYGELSCMDELYIRKHNAQHLINGYCRALCPSYPTTSISEVILYFYPKMNGCAFVWDIASLDSSQLSTVKALDSDAFGIGLPNQFFLRLETKPSASFRDPPALELTNPNYSSVPHSYHVDPSEMERLPPPPVATRGPRTIDRTNTTSTAFPFDDVFTLGLLTFPLPTKYKLAVIHCELYCPQIKEQFSVIWNINNHPQLRDYNQNDTNDPPDNQGVVTGHGYLPIPPNMNNLNNMNNLSFNYGAIRPRNINLIKNDFPMLHGSPQLKRLLDKSSKITFECKLNVLKLIPQNGSGQSMQYYGQYYGQTAVNSAKRTMTPYNYEAVPCTNDNKIRFVWNMNDTSLIQRLLHLEQGTQYHSDVFCDMLQIQVKIDKHNALHKQICFNIQLCGLPQDTDQMGIKLELFAVNVGKNCHKIRVLSEVITLSYLKAIHRLSHSQNVILVGLLHEHNALTLLCKGNIIQKYDIHGESIRDKQQKETQCAHADTNQKQSENDVSSLVVEQEPLMEPIENAQIEHELAASQAKIIDSETQVFVWRITDPSTLETLRNSKMEKTEFVNSDAFRLFDHPWYISIQSVDHGLRVLLNSLGADSLTIDAKVSISIIETGKRCVLFARFCGLQKQQIMQKQQITNIMQKQQITIRITMQIIDCVSASCCIEKGSSGPSMNDSDTKISEEVTSWLSDVVQLEGYVSLFMEHGIDEMDVVKALTMDDLKAMGIHRVGHRIKIVNNIKRLNNC